MKRFLTAFALFLLVFNVLMLIPAPSAEAQSPPLGPNTDLCVLPVQNGAASGWVKLEILDRAHIQVTFVPVGNCVTPPGQSSQYIDASSQTFSSLVDGVYTHQQVDSSTVRYDQSGDGGLLSLIDNFDSGLDDKMKDDFGGRDKKVGLSASNIGNPELTMVFNVKDAGISGACQSTYEMLTFTDNNVTDGFGWLCEDGNFINANILGRSAPNVKALIDPASFKNFDITYVYDAANNIIRHVSPGQQNTRNFQWCASVNKYRSGNCNDADMEINTTKEDLDKIGSGVKDITVIGVDDPSKTMTVVVAGAENTVAQAGGGGSAVGLTQDNCESVVDFAFNFILCPLLEAGNEMISWVDDKIISALSVENDYYENEKIQHVWANMRNIAYLLLLPAMLIMVIGTALDFKFVDAYTVKRAMPRLIIAAIFIALSYDLCVMMIEVTNAVGRGLGGIIAAPFGGVEALTLDNIFNPGAGSALITFGVLGGLIAATQVNVAGSSVFALIAGKISSISLIALGITIGIVALLLLTIFCLLALREMLIVFLIIISPLAILAWIFPENDKPWKFWWGTFSKLLLLFPIIYGFIVLGRAFASVVGNAGNSDPVFGTIIKLIAVVGPYFFIPKAFQMAGSFFANLAGVANDKQKGIFDRARKSRAEHQKRASEAYKTGNRFKNAPEKSFRARMNRSGLVTSHLGKAGGIGDYKNWSKNINESIKLSENEHADEAAKHSSGARAIAGDDDALAMARFETEEEMRAEAMKRAPGRFAGPENAENLEQTIAAIKQAKRDMGEGVFKRWRTMQQPGTGTSYQYSYETTNFDDDGNVQMEDAVDEDGNVVIAAAGQARKRYRGEVVTDSKGNEMFELDDAGNKIEIGKDAAGNAIYKKKYRLVEEDDGVYAGGEVVQRVQTTKHSGVDVLQMLDELNDAYADDSVGAGSALAKMRSAAVQAGQVVVGKAGYATMAKARDDLRKAQSRLSSGEITQQEYEEYRAEIRNTVEEDALDSSSPQEIIYGKPTSVAAFGRVLRRRITAAAEQVQKYEAELEVADKALAAGTITPEDHEVKRRSVESAKTILSGETASASAIWDAMRAATPQNADALATELNSAVIGDIGLTRTFEKPVMDPTLDSYGNPLHDPVTKQPIMHVRMAPDPRNPGNMIPVTTTETEKVDQKLGTIRELIQLLPVSDQSDAFIDRYRDWSADQMVKSGGMAAQGGAAAAPGGPASKPPGGPS